MPDKDSNTYASFRGDQSRPAPHTRRNAALIGGGVVLLVVGIAAGMMMNRPDTTPLDYPPTAAGISEPLNAPDAAMNAQGLSTDPVNDALKQADRATETSSTQQRRSTSRDRTSATAGAREYESSRVAKAICEHCGVVESATPVAVQGKNTGVGAVAGGVLGGVVGNQVGKGSGNTAATVLGAIGGGIAGNEIEKSRRTDTVYRITVRMDDGSTKTFTRKTELSPGTKVEVHGSEMQVVGSEG